MPIRAVLFDIGDTLLNATGIQQQALAETTTKLVAGGHIPGSEAFLAAYQHADTTMEAIDLNHLYSDPRLVEQTLLEMGLPPDNRIVGLFLTYYRDSVRRAIGPNISLIALFQELTAADYVLGIVSNGTTVEQLEQLVRLGIIEYLDPIVISQQVGMVKPDPAIMNLAAEKVCQRLRVPALNAAQILVVGDRPDVDVQAAHRAGMLAGLLIQHVDHRPLIDSPLTTPDYVLADLRELGDILRPRSKE